MFGNCTNRVISEEYIDFITDYELASDGELEERDICYNNIDSIYNSVYVPMEQYSPNTLIEHGYKIYVRLFGLLDYQNIEATGVTRLRSIPNLDLRGQGVLIGIVDTGIDYSHNTFLKADGTTKIASIWDQTIQSGIHPGNINYGSVYTSEQINLALKSTNPLEIVPSTDEIGHGTLLAGIIAGAEDNNNNFSGLVPDAEIVVVKLKPAKQNIRYLYAVPEDAICYQENDIMLGVKYLIDTARELDRPISICIGLGTSQGAHDVNGALSTYLSNLGQVDGIAVSIAAGNEGMSRRHYERVLGRNTDGDTVELRVGANEKGFMMEIWGDAPNTFSIELVTPGGEYVPTIAPRLQENRDISFVFENTDLSIFFQIVGSRSGAQLTIIRLRNPTEGTWKFTINKVNKALELRLNIWLPINQFIGPETYFISSTPYTTLTSPANVFIPIVATAYDSGNNSLYAYASKGYTRTDQIAPTLAAPGINVLCPVPNNEYSVHSGTSISAAYIAGIAAILLEWGKVRGYIKHLDGTDIKNLLIRGATRSPNIEYPNRDWGYGVVNIIGAYESLRGSLP